MTTRAEQQAPVASMCHLYIANAGDMTGELSAIQAARSLMIAGQLVSQANAALLLLLPSLFLYFNLQSRDIRTH
jgi:hypothetical protein